MSDGGKGSAPRPFSVDRKTFNDNYDQIFRKNKTCDKNCTSSECSVAQVGGDCCQHKVETSIRQETEDKSK